MTTPVLRIQATSGSAWGPQQLPPGTLTVVVDNPLHAELYLLFDTPVPRLPGDVNGPLYDRIVPGLAHQTIPVPDGPTPQWIHVLVNYGDAASDASVINGDQGRIASIDATPCAWAPAAGFNVPPADLIAPAASLSLTKTGSAVLAALATTGIFTTTAGGMTKFLGLALTCDTNGLVQLGTRLAGPPGLTAVYFEWFARVGIPFVPELGPLGLDLGDTATVWAAQHAIAGATLAWTVTGA